MNIFARKIIPTEFRDVQPDHDVNTNLFSQTSFEKIEDEGLDISPIRVIHSASVHYQPRFRNSKSLRFLNAFIEIISSYWNLPNDDNFYLNDNESSELQGKSTEVVGVGLSVSLISELFGINKNRISVIEDTGKRCDFTFEKGGFEYYLESKGRQNIYSISSAIAEIFEQKENYSHSGKYGIVSYLPRNETPASLIVVDPEGDEVSLNRNELILRLLKYYSKQALLAGFWRIAELLNTRVEQIEAGTDILELEEQPLDFQNIYKAGNGYDIYIDDNVIETFFNSNVDIGFRYKTDTHQYFFALDRKLIKILEEQDYSALLNYNENTFYEGIISVGDNNFSVNSDGSILASVNLNDPNLENMR